jgi:hypothetical protein
MVTAIDLLGAILSSLHVKQHFSQAHPFFNLSKKQTGSLPNTFTFIMTMQLSQAFTLRTHLTQDSMLASSSRKNKTILNRLITETGTQFTLLTALLQTQRQTIVLPPLS